MWNPPNPKAYNQKVYLIVQQIPAGKVMTYGQIAAMIPPDPADDPEQFRRLGARWVGNALRYVSDKTIPWWRVINSKGEISLPAGSAAADEQQRRLTLEGVLASGAARVDLKAHSWQEFDRAWLAEHGLFIPD
jgi:methylated-DNA-protein-cysteine methyltransferase-like protein